MSSRTIARTCAMALAGLVPGAMANLLINNWCGVGVKIVQSHNAGCDFGTDGRCISEGSQPWTISPGTGQSILGLDYITDGIGTSVKISKDDVADGILQFEYNVVQGEYGGLYWDLSDLDGSGGGLVGTPFRDQNVKVSPTGNGSGTGTCVTIRCEANKTCYDSYQHPDDPNTKFCPLDTGDIWLDLCQPYDQFITRLSSGNSPSHSNSTETIGEATSYHKRRHFHVESHVARSHVYGHKH